MPNWCNNFVQISHEDSAKIEALAAAVRDGGFCKHVVPVPEDLNIVAGRVGDDTNPEQIELERKTAENLEKYGYSTWYDFCVNEWGTKWDIDPYDPEEVIVDGNSIHFGFDSAWSPPVGVYAKLTDMGFTVDAMYYEPGMAYCGRWYDGNDEYWDIGGMSANDVADAIDSDVDEQFGISETMAEYEEQERMDEELYKWTKEGGESKGLELKSE
jgi:hypothetical protein